jgi:hypothetical protein
MHQLENTVSIAVLFQFHEADLVSMAEIEEELQRRGKWVPLMHLFPTDATHPSLNISWTPADLELQSWMRESPTYKKVLEGFTPSFLHLGDEASIQQQA